MEELLSTLKVHEIKMNMDEGQRKGKFIALKAQKSSKGSFSKSFKAEESCEEAFEVEGFDEHKVSFISRKIHSMWKNKERPKWKSDRAFLRHLIITYSNFGSYTKEVKGKSQVLCYECKKPRHFKSKCLSLEKEKEKNKKNTFFKKKKCLMEIKEDIALSSSKKDDEEANICLMVDIASEGEEDDQETKELSKANTLEVNEQLQEEVIDLRQSLSMFVNGSKT
ncbi:hypothetical protein CR513_27408, partial [Mucuna pruriens]